MAVLVVDLSADIVGIDWYSGLFGYVEEEAPSLCVCFASGRMQIMRDQTDGREPVLVDADMRCTLCWVGDSQGCVVDLHSAAEEGSQYIVGQTTRHNADTDAEAGNPEESAEQALVDNQRRCWRAMAVVIAIVLAAAVAVVGQTTSKLTVASSCRRP